jgi:hypothetical protein
MVEYHCRGGVSSPNGFLITTILYDLVLGKQGNGHEKAIIG